MKLAETPQRDMELAAHRVYLADRLVDTARATAETRLAESQRQALKEQSDADRLAARTREADAARIAAARARSDATTARNDATTARNDAAMANSDALAARSETEAARLAAQNARAEADTARITAAAAAAASEARRQELAEQIALLQARTTERGIVLTLGDVLFATGSANLKAGSIGNLDRLVTFLDKYSDRTALIEGHTDNVGSNASNEELSLRRAESVRGYLTAKGIAASRLASSGKGEMQPVTENESAAGRQQNRRVEVVIQNEPTPAVVAR